MTLWTTFCPQKVCWELTYRETNGDLPTSDWQKRKNLIRDALALLKEHGISGIRLVIFPYEITDGKSYEFSSIDYVLELCQQLSLEVDFCVGPFQYPHYPGVRLPYPFVQRLSADQTVLDDDVFFWKFGLEFLTIQMKRYGKDSRIRGFYLGNEWPDRQKIERKESLATTISANFMMQCALIMKDFTTKPILFNTNIEAALTDKLKKTFGDLFRELGDQVRIGFDVYPSQIDWKLRVLHRMKPYAKAMQALNGFVLREQRLFTELEAQPWGEGRAWEYYIKQAQNPQQAVLQYSRDSLPTSWKNFVLPSQITEINLWGSEFWLVAYHAGVTWPLEQVKEYTVG